MAKEPIKLLSHTLNKIIMTIKIFSKKFTPILKSIFSMPLISTKYYAKDIPTIFRQNYGPRTEQQMNIQIGHELQASHCYLAMANFFGRTEISLNGAASFFLAMSNEERDHALQLIDYQNMRGGRVLIGGIVKHEDDFANLIMALEQAVLIERGNTTALMELLDVAQKECDVVTGDFIASKFLNEQMEALQSLGCILTRLKRFEQPGLGEYLVDLELQKQMLMKDKNSKK